MSAAEIVLLAGLIFTNAIYVRIVFNYFEEKYKNNEWKKLYNESESECKKQREKAREYRDLYEISLKMIESLEVQVKLLKRRKIKVVTPNETILVSRKSIERH